MCGFKIQSLKNFSFGTDSTTWVSRVGGRYARMLTIKNSNDMWTARRLAPIPDGRKSQDISHRFECGREINLRVRNGRFGLEKKER